MIGRDALTDENSLNRLGSPLSEAQVELRRTAVVAVPFKHYDQIGGIAKNLLQPWNNPQEFLTLRQPDRILTEAEEDVWGSLGKAVREPLRSRPQIASRRDGSRRVGLCRL
ncbi:MAG TPA: hypothetical protein PK157_15625 [Bryobacteraceae bacterium]|nr:hypothetical protein [Bryobacteraceae bacterium]